ncbi:MAG: TRAP transporter large permease subunit [Rhodospirillales bacterium]|nr:TRAP transporter large permease subunit [Rhodospirillales bacterium]
MTIAILVATFVVLLMVGMPIAFGIGIASALAGLTYVLTGNPFVMDNVTLVQRMLFGINSFPLLACIFFVFTGVVMVRGGVAVRMVRMAEVLVGRSPAALPR